MPALDNHQYEAFAHAYIGLQYDHNAAARAVGIEENGNSVLCRRGVAQRIRELQRPLLQRHDVQADRVMLGLGRVAFADVRRMFDEDGALRPVNTLDDDIAGAIKGVKVKEEFETQTSTEVDLVTGEERAVKKRIRVVTTEVRMNDRVPALTVLAKHFKLVNDEGDGLNALASALSDRLKAARRERRVVVVDSTTPGHTEAPQEIEDARIVETDLRPQPADPSVSEALF